MKRTTILIISLLQLTVITAIAQVKPNEKLLNQEWQASWITHPDVNGEEIGVYLFKKELNLTAVPDKFIINISADNRYILYINGQVAGRGPARCDLKRWLFETIDIAHFLMAGKNHIAVKVWNLGDLKPVAQMSFKTGLIIQGNSDQEQDLNTDNTWMVYRDEAYSFYRISHLRRFYASGPGEAFDGNKHPWYWETTSGLTWKQAKVRGTGMPLKSLATTGKPGKVLLFPDVLPMMEAKTQSFKTVRRTDGIPNAEALILEGNSLVIPANSEVKILLDQGQLTNAYPQLIYSKGKDSEIKITYAESLFVPKDENPTFEKGNRDDVIGKVMWGNYDILKPDGGEMRLFEPLWWRCFRYIELEIETGEEPLLLENFESEFTAYPLELRANFNCENPMLREVFDVAWHTQRLCAGETFYDCPYYEQLQYTGDTRIQGLITAYASGDTLLWKDAIMDYYDSRFPFGLTQSRYPSSQTQIIGTFSLVWITMVHDYMMHCNDDAFIQKMLPAILDILIWYDERVEDDGLIGKLESWLFVDWAENWKLGYPPLNKDKKHSAIIGLQYVYTIQKAVEIFDFLQYSGLKKKWEGKAQKTQMAILNSCWDDQRKMLADTPEKLSFSQHANIFAVLTNTIEKEKQEDIMLRVIGDSSLTQCTYYFNFYLAEALKNAGLGSRYIEILEPLKVMIDNGLTTLVEKPEPTRSDCHAWSASPVYFYFNLICGIEPATKGFNSVRIAPQLGDLEWVNASMPHRLGDIKLSLKQKKKKGLSGIINLPEGLTGSFLWRGQIIKLSSGDNKINL